MKSTLPKIAAFMAASLTIAHGDGTIFLANNAGTRVRYNCGGSTPFPGQFNFGVFVISTDGTETLVLPLATNTASGVISAPNAQAYPIPGTTEGQIVSLHIRAWEARFGTNWMAAFAGLFASTCVRQITLGPASGPGTVIWSSTDLTMFRGLDFCPLGYPSFIVGSPTVSEGTNGLAHATFNVWLMFGSDCPDNYPKLISFTTRSGTAVAGQDFLPTNGTLSFARGETRHTITVILTPDPVSEPDEQFSLDFSNPVHARAPLSATCSITEARVIDARVDGTDAVVTFHSVAGRRYAVEFTTDWAIWAVVDGAGNISGVGGPMTVRDSGAGAVMRRFYRTRY